MFACRLPERGENPDMQSSRKHPAASLMNGHFVPLQKSEDRLIACRPDQRGVRQEGEVSYQRSCIISTIKGPGFEEISKGHNQLYENRNSIATEEVVAMVESYTHEIKILYKQLTE